MARISGKGGKSAGLQRLALLGFGALLILLFAIFAVAQGIGNPSVPSGAVAVVEDAPNDLGTVTEEEFQHALEQAAAQGKVPVPKPGDKKYDELKETALGEVLDAIWIQGQAEEMGISVTEKEIAEELKKLKDKAFKTEQQYKDFLDEAKFTQADVDTRVTIQMLSEQIQNQVTEEAPIPSKREIEVYYEAAKSSQYTTPESRDVRVIKNKDEAKVEAAKTALEKDDSNASWEKAAKKYSTDTTKGTGGLQSAVTEGAGTLQEPLEAEVFAAPQGELVGPLKDGQTYTLFEVMKITPEKVQSLDEAKSQISAQLAEQSQQQAFAAFVQGYGNTWSSRTFCANDFKIARCANFKSDGRPPEANEACFEANPKTPAEACPAPIPQVKPAVPGTVTPLNREGQKLPQRPRPAKLEEALAPEGEIPGGVVPGPTGK
ncbi:MAG TPA: peptidyl-prolyl cis-trans isomerase [Solirubrobacterales bacterium]|nr:peptidyl-prolyl cis-trans isomerase [Solirubrobacterales bacterium]